MGKARNATCSRYCGAIHGGNGIETAVIRLLLLLMIATLLQGVEPFALSTSSTCRNSRCRPQDSCFRRTIEIDCERKGRPGCIQRKRARLSTRAKRKGNDVDGGGSSNKSGTRTSMPPGYKFFRSSGRRSGDETASKTTQTTAGYVPSGMTRAEYAALKKTEREGQQSMNYGAWGPRFKRTDRPDGDWMILPNLWTLGQVGSGNIQQPGGLGNDSNTAGPDLSGLRRIPSLAQSHGLAILLGYLLVDGLYTALALWNFSALGDARILRGARGPTYAVYRLVRSSLWAVVGRGSAVAVAVAATATATATATAAAPPQSILARLAAALALPVRLQVVKLVLAVAQAPLWKHWMGSANLRWLWSEKRFAITAGSVGMAGLTLFGMLLLR